MTIDTENYPQSGNDSDRKVPENVSMLEQKLKNILSEIDNKLRNSFDYNGDDKEHYVNQLSLLAKELVQAIKGLEHFAERVSPLESQDLDELYHSAEMNEFNNLVNDRLKKLEQVNLDILP